MSTRTRCILIVGILLVFTPSLWPVKIVTVTLPKQNNRLFSAVRVKPCDLVRLKYRHSVELTAIEGLFEVGPKSELLAVETRMESVGTGLPNTFPERTIRKDGYMVVDEMHRPVGPIRFFVVPINQMELQVANQSVDISDLEAGALIEVSARKLRLIYLFLWKLGVLPLSLKPNESGER